MRQLMQAVWWWSRVVVLAVVAAYALASLWNNSGQQDVTLWYWPGRVERTSVVALALASFILGGVICTTGWALFSATVKYRRTRAERRRRLIEEQREALARKASMLRVKPAPAPIVREPKRPAPVFSPTIEPEPIVIDVPPPTRAPKSPFSAGSIPVVVDQMVVMTAPPSRSAEDVVDVVANADRPTESGPPTI